MPDDKTPGSAGAEDAEFEAQMAIARRVMGERAGVLRALAEYDATGKLPVGSPDLRAPENSENPPQERPETAENG